MTENKTLEGIGNGCGEYTGLLQIVDDPGKSQLDNFKEGSVLAAPTTNPDYIPFFCKAGAVVTKNGGLLSHAAKVSTEMGLVAVVGIGEENFAKLYDGAEVTIYGTEGKVVIL